MRTERKSLTLILKKLTVSSLLAIFISCAAAISLWNGLKAEIRSGQFAPNRVFVDGVNLSSKDVAEGQQQFFLDVLFGKVCGLVVLSLSAGSIAFAIVFFLPDHYFEVQKPLAEAHDDEETVQAG